MAGGKELKLAISIGAKIDKSLGAAINNAQAQLNKIGNISNKVGMAATAAVVAGTVKIVKDSIQTYTEYESALNSAAATAGVEKGSAAYEAMNAAAREAGATTVKTAKESAEALEYMALAGWSVEDSTKALTPVLKLSAGAGMDLGTTSDLVTDSMAAMGMTINELPHYLDVLAKGNNSANYSSQQLLESYIGVGGVLKNLNVSVEKSAAVLGVMANQGLKGSEAGTALNAILVNMQKQSGDSFKAMQKLGVSMYDTNGKTRDLIDVFQEVHDKTAGMTEQQRNLAYQMIGGKAHYEDFAKIMAGFNEDAATGTAQIYDLIKAYEGADGALDKFYDIKTDTLEGSITRLNSAYEGMLLNIGERLAPVAGKAVDNLINKMPQIENTIMSFLETLIPAASKAIDLLTQNPDKIIKTVTGIAKAFVAFKAFKGVAQVTTFVKDLTELGKVAGGLSVLKGASGALTGLGTGATAAAGAIAPVAGLLVATGAAAYYLYGRLDKVSYKWADGVHAAASEVDAAAQKLGNISQVQNELAGLKLVINSDQSSVEQIENAKSRLAEIAQMLETEYGLVINIDNEKLNETASTVEKIVAGLHEADRADFNKKINDGISEIEKSYSAYQKTVDDLPGQQAKLERLNRQTEKYSELWGKVSAAMKNYDQGMKNGKKYTDEMYLKDMASYQNQLLNFYDKFNLPKSSYADMNFAKDTGAATMWGEEFMRTGNQYPVQAKAAAGAVKDALNVIQSYENDINSITDNIASTLAGYQLLGDKNGVAAIEGTFNSYIERLNALGVSTDAAVGKFAIAKQGFTDVTEATAAGGKAIQAVINDMAKIGSQNNLFEGLDGADIAAKLTDMAHAVNLIPDNKQITINADGDFSVIDAAAATLKDTPTDITVNATDNATPTLQEVQAETDALNTGAAAPEVTATDNASPTLNTIKGILETIGDMFTSTTVLAADEVTPVVSQVQGELAALDGKKSKTTIDVTDKASGKINLLKGVFATLSGKSASASLNATDNASSKITGVQGKLSALGGVRTAPTVSLNDQATSKISSIQRGLSALPSSKTITITTNYVTKGTPPGHNAAGTPSWRGGLTYLNDQPGIADPREVVEYKGQRYWFGGRDVLADIPRGARIYNAAQSRSIIDGSHRDGLDYVPFDGYIAELHRGEQVLTESDAEEYRDGGGLFGRAIDRLRYTRQESGANGGSSSEGDINVTYSPKIVIEGNADEAAIRRASRQAYDEFVENFERLMRERRRTSFDVA